MSVGLKQECSSQAPCSVLGKIAQNFLGHLGRNQFFGQKNGLKEVKKSFFISYVNRMGGGGLAIPCSG